MTIVEGIYVEPLGCYLLVERSNHSIKRIYFSMEPPDKNSDLASQISDCLLKGKPFMADLDQTGFTVFQRKVFKVVLSAIPRGKTMTYGQVAKLIGLPKASRAVGRALGANPFAILIPCHRVLSRNGLGGYHWGVKLKQKLLAIEAANP